MGLKQRTIRPGTTVANDESYGRSDIYMSGGAINADDIVIVNNNRSGYLQVVQADASAFATARGILLVACNAASAAGQEVRCREARQLLGTTASAVDTSAGSLNAPVYLSDTAGSWSLTAGTVPVIVGRVVGVHATTGRIAFNTYADASTAGAVSGTTYPTFTINEDGVAATNEDPTLILEGGDGGAELINSMLQQDSSADRAYLWTSTTVTGTADRSSHLTIGPPGAATAGTVDADSTLTLRGHVNGAAVGTWITGAMSLDAGTDTLSVEAPSSTITIGGAAVAEAVNIATGAAARVITIGNAASASMALDAGVGALTVLADTTVDIDAGTALAINSSGGAIAIGNDAVAQPVNIATGAAARVITIGNALSASMALDAGVGALTVLADTTVDIDAGTALAINSAGGAIAIGNDAVAQAVNIATGAAARVITIGNALSASMAVDAGVGALTVQGDTTIDIDAGTALAINSSGGAIAIGNDPVAQPVNIATGAAARVITIGNAASASLALDGGVGAFSVVAGTTVDIDAGTALGINSSGGAISIGNDAVAQAVNIATGAAARVITIGNALSASMGLDAGVGALTVLADTTVDIDAGTALAINSSGGAISIGNDAVAQAVNIGTGAAARAITIGNPGSASLVLAGGVGPITVVAGTTVDIDAGTALAINSSGGAIAIGNDAVAQPVNIGTGAAARVITIGNPASASLAIDAGVGALTVQADGTGAITSGLGLTITGGGATVLTTGQGDLTLSATGVGGAILRAASSHDMSHRNQIVLFDDFVHYQNGFTEASSPWILTNGGGAGAADPAIPAAQQEGGVIVCTSGNAAVAKGTAYSQFISDTPFQADLGGLVFECRLHINTAVTTTYVACGLTDAEGEIPITIGVGNAINTVASDFVGFVYDTDADTDQWFGIAVDSDEDDVNSAAVGTAPAGDVYQTLRIEVSADGATIRFYINGAEVFSLSGAAGVSPDVNLYAFVMISNDAAGGAQRSIDVDYAYCAVNR